ncbi:predicted protein [Naegleria gruberi]|uniref:Predicted protein n=1 Tax=Naegleria gruberi TaxID=5762 RepID=D2VNW9_NAEGR|nr:uncharacterized protein NAEGRDRAFT_51100 [Naegleria gruberi]EFC41565.1 predicted protein [Naegleria gruberi]|eukprot:XP_002674309.1 predicted protein [Naegleria gruberi strain NEG-M]
MRSNIHQNNNHHEQQQLGINQSQSKKWPLFTILLIILLIQTRTILSLATPSSNYVTVVSHSHYWSSEISSSIDRVENRNIYTDEQCSCPNCVCNNQLSMCPRQLKSDEIVILASLETCGKYSQVASVGLINIETIDDDLPPFKYYLVDEDNKKKAIRGQGFDYSTLKSGGSEAHNCVSDSKPPVRFPRDGGRVYLIAKSVVNTTDVRFNIQMSCVIPPFSSIEVSASKFGDWSKFYAGNPITFTVAFKNRFSLVDTWIQGSLSVTNYRNQPEVPVVDGIGVVKFTPVGSGVVTLVLKFVPSTAMHGNAIADITAPSALVVKMASRGSFEIVPATVIVNSEFKIKYTIYDNDGTITPVLDLKKLSFVSPDTDLNCTSPKDSYGSGTVLCVASSPSSGAQIVIMMDNYIVVSKTVSIVENESLWVNILVVVLCIGLAGVIIILTVFGYCVWRKTHPHTKLVDERDDHVFEEELVVDIDDTEDTSEHQHSQ